MKTFLGEERNHFWRNSIENITYHVLWLVGKDDPLGGLLLLRLGLSNILLVDRRDALSREDGCAVGVVNTRLAVHPGGGLDLLGRGGARLQQARRVACLQGFCRPLHGVGQGHGTQQDLAVAHHLQECLAVHGLRRRGRRRQDFGLRRGGRPRGVVGRGGRSGRGRSAVGGRRRDARDEEEQEEGEGEPGGGDGDGRSQDEEEEEELEEKAPKVEANGNKHCDGPWFGESFGGCEKKRSWRLVKKSGGLLRTKEGKEEKRSKRFQAAEVIISRVAGVGSPAALAQR